MSIDRVKGIFLGYILFAISIFAVKLSEIPISNNDRNLLLLLSYIAGLVGIVCFIIVYKLTKG